jgi:PAT family beta-lactamase induction signal transducer AmpG
MKHSSRRAAAHRMVAVALLGFASGLPLALTGQALQAWLSVEGISLATIGLSAWSGCPTPSSSCGRR